MSRPVWLYVYDPAFLHHLATTYEAATSDRRVHLLALPLDRRRDVRVGDRVAVWTRPPARSVYRSGFWGIGVVHRQPDGSSDYFDSDWNDGRRKRWFVDIRFRCAHIVDGHHFAEISEAWGHAGPMCPVGLEDDVLTDFRSVCRANGLPGVVTSLLDERPKVSVAHSGDTGGQTPPSPWPPPEWAALPEPKHQGMKAKRLNWVAGELGLPAAVVVEIRRQRGASVSPQEIEAALRLNPGIVTNLALVEAQAVRHFTQPGGHRPARPNRFPQAGGHRSSRPSRTRAALPSLSALCQACGRLPNPLNGRCGCV